MLPAVLLVLSTSTIAAVISEPRDLLLAKPDPSNISPNIFLRPNRTIPEPSNSLPPSPYIYPIPFAPKTEVVFSAYSGPIDRSSALQCMLSISEDVSTALEKALHDHDPERVVPYKVMRIDADHASLIITTINGLMQWLTCGLALKALAEFLDRWEYVGLKFVVFVEEVRVGVGVLAAT